MAEHSEVGAWLGGTRFTEMIGKQNTASGLKF